MRSSGFLRHLDACNNVVLPAGRVPFRLGGTAVGWVEPSLGLTAVADQAELDRRFREHAATGLFRWRDEKFDIRAVADGPSLGTLDRGAIPLLGCRATGVHLNGLVDGPGGLRLWVARRSMDKPLDPGRLDHLAAGGIPAGMAPAEAMAKEAAEEAGLDETDMRAARHVGFVDYVMMRPEGLRRDRLHCFDLFLPESFVPVAVDGEVASFELWPIARAAEAVAAGDEFKFNVNLVLIDLFLRHGLIDPDSADGRLLARRLRAPETATAGA